MTYLRINLPTSSPYDEEIEQEWELEGVQRGLRRYRSMIDQSYGRAVSSGGKVGGLVETDAGAVIIKEVLRPLVPAIEAVQKRTMEELSRTKIPPTSQMSYRLPLLSLQADKWALITVRSLLTGINPKGVIGKTLTAVAAQIGAHGKLQREFDLWREAEEERRGIEGEVDLFRVMQRSVKKIDERGAKRWMKLREDALKLDWDASVRVHIGAALIQIAVEEGGGWFKLEVMPTATKGGVKTPYVVSLTDTARRFVDRFHGRSELQVPLLVPMIAPPKPWTFSKKEVENEASV